MPDKKGDYLPRIKALFRNRKPLGRYLLAIAIVTIATVSVFAYTQERPFTPWNPMLLTPNSYSSPDIWISGVYGTAYSTIHGPNSFTGKTLLLGGALDAAPATANWSLPFDDAAQFRGTSTNYTLYVPGLVLVSQLDTPLTVTVDGHTFSYQPTNVTHQWWDAEALYGPRVQDLHPLPVNFVAAGGDYPYLTFSFRAISIPAEVPISITTPSAGQVYLPNIVFQASLNDSTYVPGTSQTLGLLVLPVLGLLLVLTLWVMWKLEAVRYLGWLVGGVLVRLMLAPWFMHPDVVTLIRYPVLFYNYSFLDFLSFTYSLTWLGQVLVMPSAFYALGLNPTLASYDLLMKLPALGADLITFLLLIKVLQRWTTTQKAVGWAVVGWLFNPLVIYYPYIHGLTETVVALMIAVGVFGFLHGRQRWGALGVAAAVLTISATVALYPLTFVTQGIRNRWRLCSLIVPPLLYAIIVLSLYGSPSVLVSYFLAMTGRTNPNVVTFGASTLSSMTPLFALYTRTGVYLTPFLGMTLLTSIALWAYLKGYRFPLVSFPYLAYLSMVTFYMTYETFYVQHLVWIVPLVIALLVQAGVSLKRGAVYLTIFAAVGLIDNYLAPRSVEGNPYVGMVLFGLLVVPLFFPFDWTSQVRRTLLSLRPALPVISLVSALGLSVSLLMRSSVLWIPSVVLVSTLAVLVLRMWLAGRERAAGGRPLRLALEVAAMSLPLWIAFSLPTNLPALSQWLALVLAATAVLVQVEWVSKYLLAKRVVTVPIVNGSPTPP